jgi:HK97 gp10 family phage protein
VATSKTVHVDGLKELQASLNALSLEVQNRIGNQAVGAGTRIVRARIEGEVPTRTRGGSNIRGVQITPGNLKRSIRTRRLKDPTGGLSSQYEIYVLAPRRLNAKQKASGKVGAYYWRFVEFGTSKMSRRSFMRVGFQASQAEALEKIKSTLDKGIQSAARAANKGAK